MNHHLYSALQETELSSRCVVIQNNNLTVPETSWNTTELATDLYFDPVHLHALFDGKAPALYPKQEAGSFLEPYHSHEPYEWSSSLSNVPFCGRVEPTPDYSSSSATFNSPIEFCANQWVDEYSPPHPSVPSFTAPDPSLISIGDLHDWACQPLPLGSQPSLDFLQESFATIREFDLPVNSTTDFNFQPPVNSGHQQGAATEAASCHSPEKRVHKAGRRTGQFSQNVEVPLSYLKTKHGQKWGAYIKRKFVCRWGGCGRIIRWHDPTDVDSSRYQRKVREHVNRHAFLSEKYVGGRKCLWDGCPKKGGLKAERTMQRHIWMHSKGLRFQCKKCPALHSRSQCPKQKKEGKEAIGEVSRSELGSIDEGLGWYEFQ